MSEFFHAAISPLNLPFTILMGLMLLYWIFVILGAADMDWMPDMDMDMDDGGEVFSSLTEMLNIGEVPFMMVISIMVLSCWTFSMLGNHYLNPAQSVLLGTGLFVINIVLGFFATVLITRAVVKIVGPMGREDKSDQQILYRTGIVVTSQVNASVGQVDIQTKGSPIRINARTQRDVIFVKGDKVLVFDEDKEKGIYFVEKYEEE
ncbi:MAG: hypothetical protein AB7S75_10275 [Desulfococcaceae bacterium]